MSEMNTDQSPRGFSGISALVPDLDSLIDPEDEDLTPDTYTLAHVSPAPDSDSADAERNNSDQADGAEDETAPPIVSRMGCAVLLIGGAILVFLISISIPYTTNRDSDYSRGIQAPAPPRPQPVARPQPPPLPRRELPVVNKPIEIREVEASQPQKPIERPLEQKPPRAPLGLATLSIAQIRYCLAEEIRIDAARAIVDPYNHPDVDRFNAMIKDFNERCLEFRYWEGDLERAKKDIEPFRKEIQEEGRARFRRVNSPRSEDVSVKDAD